MKLEELKELLLDDVTEISIESNVDGLDLKEKKSLTGQDRLLGLLRNEYDNRDLINAFASCEVQFIYVIKERASLGIQLKDDPDTRNKMEAFANAHPKYFEVETKAFKE